VIAQRFFDNLPMEQLLATIAAWFDPELLGNLLLTWAGRLAAAIAIFFVGLLLTRVATKTLRRALERVGVDVTLRHFLGNLTYVVLFVLVALTAVGALGVPTTNFLAILGAAGLAVGLALKDSLSNFSSGVMLVLFRPFRVGDYIDAAGVAGTVSSIGIFATLVKTPDNRVITVPNSFIYSGVITNFTAESTRRIDLVIGVSYDDDLKAARETIMDVLHAEERVLKEPEPVVLVDELADSSVNIIVRPWVERVNYLAVRGALLERIKVALEERGLSIPFPQRDVHVVTQAAAK